MLFSNQREHALDISATDEDGEPATVASLVTHLCQNSMKDPRKELFVLDGHV
jgi:ubiquitin related modifier 1